MTTLCPRCRSIQSVRISTNTTYTKVKKGKNKGNKEKVLITIYHCENCNSYLGNEVVKTPVVKENFDINLPFGDLTRIDDFFPNPEDIILPAEHGSKKNKKRRKNK